MTVADYLASRPEEVLGSPGGPATLSMLGIVAHGVPASSLPGSAKDRLVNCYRVLHDLSLQSPDAELRTDAERYLVGVASVLRNVYGLDPGAASTNAADVVPAFIAGGMAGA